MLDSLFVNCHVALVNAKTQNLTADATEWSQTALVLVW
jgi:hypothetical protein